MEYKKPTPHELVISFIRTDKLHKSLVEMKMSDLNIHRSQHMMLRCINSFEEPPTQKQISEKLDISAATVAVTLKKLEASGYITKVTSDGDSRCNKVSVTKKGIDILLKGKEIISKIDEDTIRGLSDEELAIFSGCLLKIQDNLRKSGAVIPCESICTNNGERNDNK